MLLIYLFYFFSLVPLIEPLILLLVDFAPGAPNIRNLAALRLPHLIITLLHLKMGVGPGHAGG